MYLHVFFTSAVVLCVVVVAAAVRWYVHTKENEMRSIYLMVERIIGQLSLLPLSPPLSTSPPPSLSPTHATISFYSVYTHYFYTFAYTQTFSLTFSLPLSLSLPLSPSDILKQHHENCQRDSNLLPYLAIIHVRDMLIPPSERYVYMYVHVHVHVQCCVNTCVHVPLWFILDSVHVIA